MSTNVVIYKPNQYTALAQSVKAGFPMEEAEKILEARRRDMNIRNTEHPECPATNHEPVFWLELKKGSSNTTSIQVSKGTKDILESMKQQQDKGTETFESVILRLIENQRN